MSARIIVIDGEPIVRKVMSSILSRAGYAVIATDDFDKLVAEVKEAPPSLVLTNVSLPGITGHDAMCRIKQQFPNVPVLMVSGLPDLPQIEEWLGEDGFDIFPKPFKADMLIAKVQSMLRTSGGADPVENL